MFIAHVQRSLINQDQYWMRKMTTIFLFEFNIGVLSFPLYNKDL